MSTWPIHDAQARFGELLNACLSEGPQLVTRCRTEVAVLVPVDEEGLRLEAAGSTSLKELLLTDMARGEFVPRPRGETRHRPVTGID